MALKHNLRLIDTIVVHCSATPPGMDIGAARIRTWHTSPDPNDPSKPWRDIGYHYVIRRNGEIEAGRPIDQPGAHVRGHNETSLGICLVGGIDEHGSAEDNFTKEQKRALRNLLYTLQSILFTEFDYITRIVGHDELDPKKDCPCFELTEWLIAEGF